MAPKIKQPIFEIRNTKSYRVLEKAIALAGSQAALAHMVGCSAAHISECRMKNTKNDALDRIGPYFAHKIERALKGQIQAVLLAPRSLL